jgi:hypothetical protein
MKDVQQKQKPGDRTSVLRHRGDLGSQLPETPQERPLVPEAQEGIGPDAFPERAEFFIDQVAAGMALAECGQDVGRFGRIGLEARQPRSGSDEGQDCDRGDQGPEHGVRFLGEIDGARCARGGCRADPRAARTRDRWVRHTRRRLRDQLSLPRFRCPGPRWALAGSALGGAGWAGWTAGTGRCAG